MKRNSPSILRWISLLLIFAAVLLTVVQLIRYSRIRNSYPPGMEIAGVPVGGLTNQQAADRLVQAYGVPVELRYNDASIQIKPSVVGFEIDLQGMLAAAELQRINQPFWQAFWEYLWNQQTRPASVPLRSNISEDRLRSFLVEEVAARYDTPPTAPMPVAGSVEFQPGQTGTQLDVERAVTLISDALRSPNSRMVNLTYNKVNPPRASLDNLEILLKQAIDLTGFDGIIEIYLYDLQNYNEMHFAYQQGQDLTPDISFTAASTMKIPIMVSVFRRVTEPTPPDVDDLLSLMIEFSENDPSDRLMDLVIERGLGPLSVTEDMQTLGLKNTFLAGYFYNGAPLLYRYDTPANIRTDVFTDPDPYNQTTSSDMGTLLTDIYTCAEFGNGTFMAAFPGEITQGECRQMINYLVLNDMPMMIQGGVTETTRVAHKHGWVQDPTDGYMHLMSDVGIVYSPGGNYVLTMFAYHPVQLLFDPMNETLIDLSRAIFNYYNPPQ